MPLALWFDPSDDSRVTLNGSRITDIEDKSPEGNDLAEFGGTDGPEQLVASINALDTADFATDDQMQLVSGSVSGMAGASFVIASAYVDDGTAVDDDGIFHRTATAPTGDSDGWRLRRESGGDIRFSVGDPATQFVDITTAATSNNIDIIVAYYDSDANFISAYKNGTFIGADIADLTLGVAHSLRVGADPGDESFIGEFGDQIFFEGKLSSEQRQRIEGYLAHKWNSTLNLPDGHPFKYIPPDLVFADASKIVANFEGDDGDTSYTFDTGEVLTFNNNCRLTDLGSKFGRTCLEMDGGADDHCTIPDAANLELSDGSDFMCEFWVRTDDAAGTSQTILNKGGITGSIWSNWVFQTSSSGYMQFVVVYLGGEVSRVISTTELLVGVWYHIAGTWDASADTTRIYVNGILEGTDVGSSDVPYATNTNPLSIGNQVDISAANHWHGAMDSLRIVNDAIIYTADFAPPVRPFREPHADAELICNFNGDDAATSYTSEDSAGRTATFVNQAEIDHAQEKFEISSMLFDGNSDAIHFPDGAAWELAAGEYTVECWVRWDVDVSAGTSQFVGHYRANGDNRGWGMGIDGNFMRFIWSGDGTSGDLTFHQTAWNPVIDVWYHVAVCRDAEDILHMYLDGVHQMSEDGTGTYNDAADPLTIGAFGFDWGGSHDGWIDGVRVIKGTSIYANVIVPDQIDFPLNGKPPPTLLLKFDGTDGDTAYTSDDDAARTITLNSAELDEDERQWGSTSLYMSAAGDNATIPDASDLDLGTNDFTIELWFKEETSAAGNRMLYDQRQSGVDETRPTIYLVSTDVVRFFVDNVAEIIGTTVTSLDTWHHVVLERVSAVTRLYLDGVQEGSDFADTNTYLGGVVTIGEAGFTTGVGVQGWIDGVRVWGDRAYYQGDFDPPVTGAGEVLD